MGQLQICNECNQNRLKTTYFRDYKRNGRSTNISIKNIHYCNYCLQCYNFFLSKEEIIKRLKLVILPSDSLSAIIDVFSLESISVNWIIWNHYQYEIQIAFHNNNVNIGYWKMFDNSDAGRIEIEESINVSDDETMLNSIKELLNNPSRDLDNFF